MSEKSSSGNQPVQGDDRNLVAAQDSEASVSAEEWLFDFWKKYKTLLIGVCVVAIAVIAGRAAVAYFQEKQEASTRAAFAAAETREQLLAFSRQYSGHALGTVALLNVGDEYYKEGDYTNAGKYYAEAEGVLEDRVLADRARLGRGMAALQAGLNSEAETALRGLADDEQTTEGLRAEALYHLAFMAHAEGNDNKAHGLLDELSELAPTGIWASQGSGLRSQLSPVVEEDPIVDLPSN